MAARRLIVVLAVLLAISIAAAAIAPDRRSSIVDSSEPESTTTAPEDVSAPRGALVEASVVASTDDPETIEAEVGDQLSLEVVSDRPLQLTIQPLGLTEDVAADTPARFDVLLREAGILPVAVAARPGLTVARIEVSTGRTEVDRRPRRPGGSQ